MAPGFTVGAEGCPIQAISRCLSPVLMCEMGHCCVTKSLCNAFWSIQSFFNICVIQINHLLMIMLFEFGDHPVTPAIPHLRTFVFHAVNIQISDAV